MSYRYVDRIFSITDSSLQAVKLVTRGEKYWVWFDAKRYLNPSIIVESLIQAGQWWAMVESDFKLVLIPTYIKRIDFFELVGFGRRLDLNLSLIDKKDEKTGKLKLQAQSDGSLVCEFEIEYKMVDIAFLYDRDRKKIEYKNIFRPELIDEEKISSFESYRELVKNSDHVGYEFIDLVEYKSRDEILCSMNISSMLYYLDDYTRRSVPISQILMGAYEGACFLNEKGLSNYKKDLKLKSIVNLRGDLGFRQGDSIRFKLIKNKENLDTDLDLNSSVDQNICMMEASSQDTRFECGLIFD